MTVKDRDHIPGLHWYSLGLPDPLQTAVWISIIVVFVLSILDLAGWIFNITLLKSIMPEWIPMKIITAVCFIFTSTALVIIKVNLPAILKKILPRVLTVFILLISLITLYVYLFSIKTGHESFLTEVSYLTFFTAPASRMAFLAAVNFFILGCIVFLLTADKTKASDLGHVLVIPVALVSYFVPVSYMLGVYSATELMHMPVALNTGIAFCGICIAVLLMQPDTWLLKVFKAPDTGGIVARKLLLPLIILPVVIAWLRINGERAGLFKSEVGVVLVALTYTACFLALVWLTARSVSKIDRERQISENALRESEERFKAMAEVSPVGMGVVGFMDGNFLYINPSYEQYLGYDKDELLSKNAPEIFWDIKDRELIYKKLGEDNFVSNYEVKLKRKDGSSFWSMSSIRPIKFMNKPALLGTFIDISKRKEVEDALHESEQRLKYHFENSPLAVVEWDKDYYVTQWSNEAEKIFGWKKEEVVGKRIDALNMVYEEDIPILEETMKRLSGGKEFKVVSSNRNYTKNREIRECTWYSSVLHDEKGKTSSIMSLVEDLTEISKVGKLLKESENKLWSIVNATQESIYMFDRDGRFTMSNSTGLKRLNSISEKDLIGHHFSEFMTVELARHRQEKLDVVFKTGKPLEFEDVRNGITFHNNFFPLFEDKKVSHVVTYSTDITDRKKAEKELESTKEYLENLINYANAPIIVWNPDTRIQLFNHAFEHLTGYSSSEVQGKKLDMLFPKGSLKESNTKIKEALTENWKTIEIPILTKNKKIRTVLWNSANIFDTDKKTVLSTIAQGNDITERINAEQKLKERTKELEVANHQLKELNATKDKFFNIVAHDLKNPFTSLMGSSELLSHNIDQMDNEKIKTLAFILNDASKSGYAILQNLLDWSRSQTGLLKFNPEEINLRNLIDEQIQNLEQISANKEIKLFSEVKDNLFVYSDKNMIKTIMRNLLSNAIKYSYRCGKVIVRANIDDLGVIVSVKDNGIGIPEENIKNIFRIDVKYSVPGTEKEQGTGLGLKLCKEFVEKQGGKIWVESIENKGSEFKFSIPVKEG